jgi:hypothetical protein
MRRVLTALLVLVCLSLVSVTFADAQTNSYKQTNLVSDMPWMAPAIDSNLANPCGICIIPDDPFWISDNASAGGVTSPYKTDAMKGTLITKTDGFRDPRNDVNRAVIIKALLWDTAFEPTGQTGDPHTTNVTAGLNNEMPGLRGTTTVMITGTSGNLTHSASVTFTVQ